MEKNGGKNKERKGIGLDRSHSLIHQIPEDGPQTLQLSRLDTDIFCSISLCVVHLILWFVICLYAVMKFKAGLCPWQPNVT